MGKGRLSAGTNLTDDAVVQLVFDQLMQEPAFRAQARAADSQGIDLLKKVKEGMLQSEDILEEVAKQYFSKHLEMKTAPYAMFLVYRPESMDHEVCVQVGNAAITAMRRSAAMQLMNGEIALEVVDAG